MITLSVFVTAIVLSSAIDSAFAAPPATFDANRAMSYLQKVCRLGPRPSGSRGMTSQQAMIVEHFSRLGARVRYQPFDAADPVSGVPVRMANIIVSWRPDAAERVLFCCHYDTRPFPENDATNPRGTFIGANDGASGVALFMELGHQMAAVQTKVGVDFVFFDGEEYVFGNHGKYFLGSTHFATDYRDHPPTYRYHAGVLVDMIGDRDLQVLMEQNSLRLAPDVTRSVWEAAARAGVKEFIARGKHELNDDHLPLNEIAKIPTCDVVDFDYPYWHTTRDLPNRCSGESLAKISRVLLEWLRAQLADADGKNGNASP